jgi:hypothetical protein
VLAGRQPADCLAQIRGTGFVGATSLGVLRAAPTPFAEGVCAGATVRSDAAKVRVSATDGIGRIGTAREITRLASGELYIRAVRWRWRSSADQGSSPVPVGTGVA